MSNIIKVKKKHLGKKFISKKDQKVIKLTEDTDKKDLEYLYSIGSDLVYKSKKKQSEKSFGIEEDIKSDNK